MLVAGWLLRTESFDFTCAVFALITSYGIELLKSEASVPGEKILSLMFLV